MPVGRSDRVKTDPRDARKLVDDGLGTGYRAAVEQLEAEAAERVREANLAPLRKRDVRFIATNALYAVATKAF